MLQKYLPYVIGLLGVILVGVGIVVPKLKTEEPEITIETKGTGEQGTGGKETRTIIVDVEGAVEKPGVYELPNNSRIADALIPAGGLSAKADRDAISKTINLAQKLTDGTKIYFPTINDSNNSNNANNANVSNLTNINSASLADLDKLPGIGPITAQKIVNGRPYQNISDLISRKILGTSVFNQIKDKLSVY